MRRLATLLVVLAACEEAPGAGSDAATVVDAGVASDAAGDASLARQVERVAASLGDTSMFPRLRQLLANPMAEAAAREHAFLILSRAADPGSLAVFLGLLDEPKLRLPVLGLLARFEGDQIAAALLSRLEAMSNEERSVALNRTLGEDNLSHAQHHYDIVLRFGRFPHRNLILGRTMRPEEQEYLDNGGYRG